MPNDSKEQEKLLQLVITAIQQDQALRSKFQIENKFRFIQDRLHTVLSAIEDKVRSSEIKDKQRMLGEPSLLNERDQALVYLYLFNAQGLNVSSWQKMLNPSAFYEYSVNRPIYAEKSQVESFIRSKENQALHAYLTIVVAKLAILSQAVPTKDMIGQALVKVKEGSLLLNNVVSFTHQSAVYFINEVGELVKK